MRSLRLHACVAILLATSLPASAAGIRGEYVEARTCDVWTGACFAMAEVNFAGKHAVMAWRIEQGEENGVKLDGLSVLAVVEATDTLGSKQTGDAKAALIVDAKADAKQRDALVALAKRLGGDLTKNVVKVDSATIAITLGHCKDQGCASVDAGTVKIATRCIHEKHDSACGHEENFYPPLAKGVKVNSAFLTEHTYSGKAFNKTWTDTARRGAYIGSFEVKD